jgi:hypothetical protein
MTTFKEHVNIQNISIIIDASFTSHMASRYRKIKCRGKGKAIPVTGCGDPQGCEMWRLPHFLNSWLTDD